MIARQIPNDPHWAEVIFAAKIENLFLALRRRPVGVPFWDGRRVNQACFAPLGVGLAPPVKAGAANPKIAASLCNMANLSRVAQNPQLTLNLALILVHEHLLLPKFGRLTEMSRE